MPFKIVRNDITKMNTDAIVNTANDHPTVGTGCDHAVYEAAGYEELLEWRKEKIGFVKEGDAFITPGFRLPARYIIHAVSPLYIDGLHGEEELLRSCYRKSLALAKENGIRSIAFPLISTGGFGYPKEEGMRIAVDEIHAFLLTSSMQIYLVVFDEKATRMGKNLYPDLEAYIDANYVEEKQVKEYWEKESPARSENLARREGLRNERRTASYGAAVQPLRLETKKVKKKKSGKKGLWDSVFGREDKSPFDGFSDEDYEDAASMPSFEMPAPSAGRDRDYAKQSAPALNADGAVEELERKLSERMKHMADSFPQYLLYLIDQKGLQNADVYKRAIVDKKVFSKIKNNPHYHPQKLTALCLCVGAKLNLDETKELLARAGYALSPCDKTDIIFSYFIENKIYDMIEIDIQLEEHGVPCIIS